MNKITNMGDATKEAFELEEGPVDSQEPLTAGYGEKEDYVRDPQKDKKKVHLSICWIFIDLGGELCWNRHQTT